MNLQQIQHSQYLWNIFFSRGSIWVLLQLVCKRTQCNTLPKPSRRNVKLNKFAFGTAWLPELSCKHWFKSSVWNLCRWVADVPPRENDSQRQWARRNVCHSQAGVFHIIGTFAIRYLSQVNLGDGGGGSHTKVTGIIVVVFFRERNCGFWPDLGCVQDGKPKAY